MFWTWAYCNARRGRRRVRTGAAGLDEGRRRLQHSDRRRRQTQDDRRAGGVERCSGHGPFATTAEPAREILEVEKIDVVADKGYFRTEDIASCEQAGLTPYVPRPQRGPAVKNGFFRKDEFRYDAARDAYVCPAGQELTPIREGKLRELKKVDYGNAKACRACALRVRCTTNVRAVSRLEDEDALDRMSARLKARPEILDRRRETVEHPFGTIKQWMNQGAFLMRGLEKVRAEFSLTALAYNLRRALNILGMEGLMAAVAA